MSICSPLAQSQSTDNVGSSSSSTTTPIICDRLHGVATVALTATVKDPSIFIPTIDGRQVVYTVNGEENPVHIQAVKVIFEVAAINFIKILALNDSDYQLYYANQKSVTEKTIRADTYFPAYIDIISALSKASLLPDDYAHCKILQVAFNRFGVVVLGADEKRKTNYLFWGSPQSTGVANIGGTWTAYGRQTCAKNNRGILHYERGKQACVWNNERAKVCDLEKLERESPQIAEPYKQLMAIQKAEREKEVQEVLRKSGLQIANHTTHTVTVSPRIDEFRESGIFQFIVKINGKNLITPTSFVCSGPNAENEFFSNSRKMTFDALAKSIIRITEVDHITTNVTYVDTSREIHGVAYYLFQNLPNLMSLEMVKKQIENSHIPMDYHLDMGLYNNFGFALVALDSQEKEKFFFYGAADDSMVRKLPTDVFSVDRVLYLSWEVRSQNREVAFYACHSFRDKPAVFTLNSETATPIEAAQLRDIQIRIVAEKILSATALLNPLVDIVQGYAFAPAAQSLPVVPTEMAGFNYRLPR